MSFKSLGKWRSSTLKMNSKNQLVQGYLYKSPSRIDSNDTWQERRCTLCLMPINVNDLKVKKRRSVNKNKSRTSSLTSESPEDLQEHFVFSYYKNEKENPTGQFIFDDIKIEKIQGGIRNFEYAIKVEIPFHDRVLYLCHKEENKLQHEAWWKVLEEKICKQKPIEDDVHEFANQSVKVFEENLENPIFKKLQQVKAEMSRDNQDLSNTGEEMSFMEEVMNFKASDHEPTDSGISTISSDSANSCYDYSLTHDTTVSTECSTSRNSDNDFI